MTKMKTSKVSNEIGAAIALAVLVVTIGAGTCQIPTDGQSNCGGSSSASCTTVVVPWPTSTSAQHSGPEKTQCVGISTQNDRKPKTCAGSGGGVRCSEDDSASVVRQYEVYPPILNHATPPKCIDCDLQHPNPQGVGESVLCPVATTVPGTESECTPPTDSKKGS
jgi:hypothetical protein